MPDSIHTKLDLLDYIPVGACVITPQLEVVFWNRCLEDWTRIDRQTILGTNLSSHFPNLSQPKYMRRLEQIFKGGMPALFSSQLHKYLIPCPNPNGGFRNQDTAVTALPVGDNSYYALICIQDVTALTTSIQEFKSMRDRAVLEVEERKRTEAELQKKTKELEEKNRTLYQINRMTELLQSCHNVSEAYQIIATSIEEMFPQVSVGIYQIDQGLKLLELVTCWGDVLPSSKVLNLDDCWAMRRAKIHFSTDKINLCCQKIFPHSAESCCLPLVIQGEIFGLLFLWGDREHTLTKIDPILFSTLTEQLSIILANIKLRDTLQQQSIRDGLTGLFNRRYLDEVLPRHLRRCEYDGQELSLIMIDVDFFKHINDNFGHPVGDMVLQALAQFVVNSTRPTDICCRYGGEEIVILLPNTNLETATNLAERLRTGFSNLIKIQELTGKQTISLGVATAPVHGNTGETLLKQVDSALYLAKRQGRNCIVVAHSP